MLPLEVLSKVAANLSRADLAQLQQVNIACRDLVARDFAATPLVHIKELRILGRRYFFKCSKHDVWCMEDDDWCMELTDDDEFVRNIKLCFVEKVIFPFDTFDNIDLFLRVKSAWANGTVYAPRLFEEPAETQRMFNELFLCKRLRVETYFTKHFDARQPFFTLEAVRRCSKLELFMRLAHSPYDVVKWLHRKTEWDEPKELEVCYQGIDLDHFLDLMKAAFNAADEPCSYRVKLYEGREDAGRERKHYLNMRTSECLQVRLTRWDLVVQRGPLSEVLHLLKNETLSV